MIKNYKQLLTLFDRAERLRFYFLLGFMVLVALAEVIGISSVLVLLNVLSEPDQVLDRKLLSAIYESLGFSSFYSFQVFLAVAVFFIVFLSLAIKAYGAYLVIKFATMRGYSISSRLLEKYLNQPYEWFLRQNSSDITKNVLGQIDVLVGQVIIPMLRLTAATISSFAIVTFLLAVDPYVSIFSALVLGISYTALYLKLRSSFQGFGRDVLRADEARYRLVGEALGGIKQIKLYGLESSYTNQFKGPAQKRAISLALNLTLGQLPRYALEAITFGLLLTLILILLLSNSGDLAATIPTLGIFAFAVMRLLPAIQQIYNSLVTIKGGEEPLNHIVAANQETLPVAELTNCTAAFEQQLPELPLTKNLVLSDLSYSYELADRQALEKINLQIEARNTIGIVGGTGAGKTTLVDIILGVLPVRNGKLIVDGVPITEANIGAWQRSIGYVPQDIYLSDDTIARNIAFGIPPEKIDPQAVEQAARAAALHDFVTNELPMGYQTNVGERGVRLSGGQRQRIGIARALYRNPSLLVMDEATSALDTITERVIMEAVHNIRADKTIILIAHRLSTVRECDQILLMQNGKVSSSGTYDDLVSNSAIFREMAKST
ncbi:ABC-type multidrug transport system, ATPase and permease component [Ruegeria halocynthiae]|uniref:ABC-type multidrug transport system, ATPase and permease component n=1 Tax=Ruegeria halocynthiae TaxID=985054 RepID=A0A1H2YF38_9RHOB|nr:ABC transporter ATP-binding protein [Ruegeria halocynthiae]SDX03448.1 ABC-type multidrug transport system, ATPase and permease component [Ruegeria halocynthiae]